MIALLLLSEENLTGIVMIYDNKRNDMVESGDWLYCIDVRLMIFIVRLAKTWKGVGHILRKLEFLLLVEKP